MITVMDRTVTEVRHEWVIKRPGNLLDFALDEEETDEAEARQIAEIEEGTLWKREVYVMEETPCQLSPSR